MQSKFIFFSVVVSFLTGINVTAQKVYDITLAVLPARYYQLLGSGINIVEKRLREEPDASLATLESKLGWSHFPSAILMPAVLYIKADPANKWHRDPKMLQLALRIGDLLVKEQAEGNYSKRGDSDWDTYMWLETYRILENRLGEERRPRWKKALLEELSRLEPKLAKCVDYPWYNALFIITSPNHYAIYASILLVAGHVFDKPDWVKMSTKVLHRYCVREQAADGYWGEDSQAGPTTGYDYLTSTQIALYWEYSKDPDALKALRRNTYFHEYFTYPDGTPVETINDHNRYWGAPMWGQFGFSHFPDGRRYAAFLTTHFPFDGNVNADNGDMLSFGRIAQNLLYFHEGKTAPIPQDLRNYAHAMKIPAGIRKTGPWVVTYSGIIAPPVSQNNFFLDRQGNLSVFNEKARLIISGANSKHQPELATFTEVIGKDSIHMPVSAYFKMGDKSDKLALAYNVFFATIDVPRPTTSKLTFDITTTYKYGEAVSELNLQLMLKPGSILETGSGKKIKLGGDKIELDDASLGGWIKDNGWKMQIPQGAHLVWLVYPYNPYRGKLETDLSKAIGRLFIPLKNEDQEFHFALEVN